jgi:hypothetical protein
MIDKPTLDLLGESALKYGITTFKCADFEVTFTIQQPKIVFAPSEMPTNGIGAPYGMPTEDELLFASSIPMTQEEIQARPPA